LSRSYEAALQTATAALEIFNLVSNSVMC